jgi:GNAT superfamily N-acetyltransferase
VDNNIVLRLMRPGEETEIYDLVAAVFNEFIGCHYPPEGVREFLDYIRPSSLRERFLSNHFTLVAAQGQAVVGVIEVREGSHICLFFVDARLHGQGIGRGLFERALAMCREGRPDCPVIDVNSSPNSIGVYERMGFHATGSQKTINGITFVPMALELQRDNSG